MDGAEHPVAVHQQLAPVRLEVHRPIMTHAYPTGLTYRIRAANISVIEGEDNAQVTGGYAAGTDM